MENLLWQKKKQALGGAEWIGSEPACAFWG
jgi:hypothetical protein